MVPDVRAAEGMLGVTEDLICDGGMAVVFDMELEPDEMGWDSLLGPASIWSVHELEVLNDGGEQ